MDTEPKKEAQAFLSANSVGVLATTGPSGEPRARTVYYQADESFGIYFITLAKTRKTADLAHDARAAFVVSSESVPQTLQAEGRVEDLTENAENTELVHSLLNTLFEKGPRFAPVTRLDMSEVRLYKLTPSWVRFGNFSQGQGTDEVLHEILL